MMDRKQEIKDFISHIIDKDYASANKSLRSIVEGKLKQKVAKAKKKNLY